MGRMTVNTLPSPGAECTSIVPFIFSTERLTRESPMPVPMPCVSLET